MQRIFIQETSLSNQTVQLTHNDRHHLFQVCRLKPDDAIEIVIQNKRLLLCKICRITSTGFTINILDQWGLTPNRSSQIHVIQSLPKQDKLTHICKRCTEIGVSNIYPIVSDHCMVKHLSSQKIHRIQSSIESAAKQSKQTAIPTVHPVTSLTAAMSNQTIHACELKLVAYEGSKQTLRNIPHTHTATSICMAIGPEGGYSLNDIETLKAHGFFDISLGPYILRTEHAACAAIHHLDGYFLHAPK